MELRKKIVECFDNLFGVHFQIMLMPDVFSAL